MTPRHWLVKSEPESFSFDDLVRAPKRTTRWDGVRNYQARNLLRDEMAVGDQVFFYHSSTEPPGIAGVAEVVRAGYPDPTAFDRSDDHFDAKSRQDAPAWFAVDLRAVARVVPEIPLSRLRETKALEGMVLLRKGSRLSVQPVTAAEWKVITSMAALVTV